MNRKNPKMGTRSEDRSLNLNRLGEKERGQRRDLRQRQRNQKNQRWLP